MQTDFEVRAVNDCNTDDDNLRYLLRFDSLYGRFPYSVSPGPGCWVVDSRRVARFSSTAIDEVPWASEGVDIVIDSSGAGTLEQYSRALEQGVSGIVVTRDLAGAPTVIAGVNDASLSHGPSLPDGQGIIASSTCDGNALALVLSAVRRFGIVEGSVTTLHPWLGYQSLVDTALNGGVPGDYELDHEIGRAAPSSLIPKRTSVLTAVSDVMPEVAGRLVAQSFRVPIGAVSCLDLTLRFAQSATVEEIHGALRSTASASAESLSCSEERIVSIDVLGLPTGAVADLRWTQVTGALAKLVAWYDNEAGYSSQVLRCVAALRRAQEHPHEGVPPTRTGGSGSSPAYS